jgi:hypothetical protein
MVAITALALIGCFNSVQVASRPGGAFLDSEFVAVLLAVVLLGPVPAFFVWLAGELAYILLLPRRLVANLANIASYGWAAVTGALVLDAIVPGGVTSAVDPLAWVAVAVTGVVVLSVNFAITNGIVATVMDGRPLGALTRELVATAPAAALMILTGTAIAFLYLAIGIPALALFSAAVFIPRLASRLTIDQESVAAGLEHSEALPLYAQEIASEMNLGSAVQLVVKDAASFIRGSDMEQPRGRLSDLSEAHRHALVEALIYKGEHWDGRGGQPGAVGGEMIPLTSRILAVADAWALLTTGGYPRLTDAQALDLLEARAGLHFDPAVVAVAARLVDRGSCY